MCGDDHRPGAQLRRKISYRGCKTLIMCVDGWRECTEMIDMMKSFANIAHGCLSFSRCEISRLCRMNLCLHIVEKGEFVPPLDTSPLLIPFTPEQKKIFHHNFFSPSTPHPYPFYPSLQPFFPFFKTS